MLATFFDYCKHNYCFRTDASSKLSKPLRLLIYKSMDPDLISTNDMMGHEPTRELEHKRKFSGKNLSFVLVIKYCTVVIIMLKLKLW